MTSRGRGNGASDLDRAAGLASSSKRRPSRERQVGLGLLLAILALATVLRFHDIGGKALWIDEANGVLISQSEPGEILDRLVLDSSPPLYYFALGGWTDLFGSCEVSVRALSALGGVLLVGVLFLISWSLFSLEVATFAGLLLALSPVQVFYSQQARMYTWLTVVGVSSSYFLWRAATEDRARFILAYAGSLLLALYLHNLAFYLLPGHVIVLLWQRSLGRRPLLWAIAVIGVVLGYLPWLPYFLSQLGNETHYAWFRSPWDEMGILGALRYTALSFAPSMPELPFRFAEPAQPSGIAALGVLLLVVASLTWLFRRPPGPRASTPTVGWLLLMVLCPPAFCLLASYLVQPNYVPGRSDQIVFPGFLLLVSLGLVVIRPRVVRYGVFLLLLVSAAWGLRQYYGNESDRSERELAARIAGLAGIGDVVLCTSLSRAPMEYYLRLRHDAPVTLFSYPRGTSLHLGNQDDAELLSRPDFLRSEIDSVWSELGHHFLAADQARGQAFVLVVLNEVNRYFHEDLRSGGRHPTLEVTQQLGLYRSSGNGDRIGVDVVALDTAYPVRPTTSR